MPGAPAAHSPWAGAAFYTGGEKEKSPIPKRKKALIRVRAREFRVWLAPTPFFWYCAKFYDSAKARGGWHAMIGANERGSYAGVGGVDSRVVK